MTENENENLKAGKAKADFDVGTGAKVRAFFKPKDFDIYVNKVTGHVYFFHGPDLPHEVDRLEYDSADNSVTVFTKNGLTMDLGVKIQWLVRPYVKKAKEIFIVKTKNGEMVDGVTVPITIK